ncbi:MULTISPECIES: hypothetical protein [unclassified Rathayibacter]|uniref:hypothetical protein n=1 Tax=unclassified Rathayibacter TaxID=2609250 RepID=UPI00188D8879|nr:MULTISPECIES: hypothetical protein [unclassified Rathayibacter]MBF4461024.1 hypothetical protein [Rathayibacter sp. VKM Ac-2879]MBF4502435.1 hypothetical protein [Rathayibacter sp. VKM Ac-2878]
MIVERALEGQVRGTRGPRFVMIGAASLLCVGLAGCTSAGDDSGSGSSAPGATTASTAPTASEAPSASAGAAGYDAYCDATRASAAAKSGSVADDITATQAQAAATRALLPLSGAPSEVAAGAEAFADSADATVEVLQQFPSDSAVAEVGSDPRFASVAQEAATDPNYIAFVGWTIQTCKLGTSG